MELFKKLNKKENEEIMNSKKTDTKIKIKTKFLYPDQTTAKRMKKIVMNIDPEELTKKMRETEQYNKFDSK